MFKVYGIMAISKIEFFLFSGLKRLKKVWKIKNHSKPPKIFRQSLFKQLQQNLNIFLVFQRKINPFDLFRSLHDISKTVRVNLGFKTTVLKDKPSNDIQIDRLCTCGSQVINVEKLWNHWNLTNQVFKFFRDWKG